MLYAKPMNMSLLFSVAAGGAVGASLRFLAVSLVGRLLGHNLPWGTLAVNIAGAFLLGALVEGSALRWQVSEVLRAFLVVGMLGGFTTFSAFSLDAVLLYQRGDIVMAALYVLASVALSLTGLCLGMAAMRGLLA